MPHGFREPTTWCKDNCGPTSTPYNTLQTANCKQHTATHGKQTTAHYNKLHLTAMPTVALRHTATHCNTLQLAATRCYIKCSPLHCNTLQHTATHHNSLPRHLLADTMRESWVTTCDCVAVCCNMLQCIAVCCSKTRVKTRSWSVVLRYSDMCCSVLQCVAVCCSVLQCVAVCCSM